MRRAAGAAALAVAVAVAAASPPDADAQIYTRRNQHGVIEATNVPAERGYNLTYPGKGTLIHSAAWRLRRTTTASTTTTSPPPPRPTT